MSHTKRLLILISFAIVILGLVTFDIFRTWKQDQNQAIVFTRATQEVERALTESNSTEVKVAIENFHTKWLAYTTIKDPDIQLQIATRQYYNHIGLVHGNTDILNQSSFLVTNSAIVKDVRVIEFSPQRFKATACIVDYIDRVTSEGILINSLAPHEFRGIYVFVRENGKWKIAGNYNTTNPTEALHDWEYTPNWLQQTIGDLPNLVDKDCHVQP